MEGKCDCQCYFCKAEYHAYCRFTCEELNHQDWEDKIANELTDEARY